MNLTEKSEVLRKATL